MLNKKIQKVKEVMGNRITKKLFFILLSAVLFPAVSYTQQFATAAMIPYASSEEYDNAVVDNFYDENYYTDGQDSVTLETFQYALPADDGQWIQVSPEEIDPNGYSDEEGFDNNINTGYIWRPNNMDPYWNPYTNGYWEYTDYGWMWVSNYDWDATYHYGRWWYSNRWGWVWSPGYQWAPSWVCWRENENCVGWYPLSPRSCWDEENNCYNVNNYNFIENNWTFVEVQNFHNTVITTNNTITNTNNTLITKTKTENNIKIEGGKVINNGPPVQVVENVTGKKIPVLKTDDIKKYPVSVNTKNSTGTVNKKTDGTTYKTKNDRVNNTKNDGTKVIDTKKITETKTKLIKPDEINTQDAKIDPKTNNDVIKSNSSKVIKPTKDTKSQPNKEIKKSDNTVKQEITKPNNDVKKDNNNSGNNTKTYIPPVKHDTYNPPPKIESPKTETRQESPKTETRQESPKTEIRQESPKTETKQDTPKGDDNSNDKKGK